MATPGRSLPTSAITPDNRCDRALSGASVHSEASSQRMTYAEFATLPEQRGLQLIDGLLVQEPSASDRHQGCAVFLTTRLQTHVEAHRIGKVRASLDVTLTEEVVLQPDVLFLSSRRRHVSQPHGLSAAPDLAVEILSPSTRRYDLGRKRDLYFQHGCAELWIVDLDAEVMIQHVRGPRGWEERELTRGDVLTSTAVAGFTLDVASVFGDI